MADWNSQWDEDDGARLDGASRSSHALGNTSQKPECGNGGRHLRSPEEAVLANGHVEHGDDDNDEDLTWSNLPPWTKAETDSAWNNAHLQGDKPTKEGGKAPALTWNAMPAGFSVGDADEMVAEIMAWEEHQTPSTRVGSGTVGQEVQLAGDAGAGTLRLSVRGPEARLRGPSGPQEGEGTGTGGAGGVAGCSQARQAEDAEESCGAEEGQDDRWQLRRRRRGADLAASGQALEGRKGSGGDAEQPGTGPAGVQEASSREHGSDAQGGKTEGEEAGSGPVGTEWEGSQESKEGAHREEGGGGGGGEASKSNREDGWDQQGQNRPSTRSPSAPNMGSGPAGHGPGDVPEDGGKANTGTRGTVSGGSSSLESGEGSSSSSSIATSRSSKSRKERKASAAEEEGKKARGREAGKIAGSQALVQSMSSPALGEGNTTQAQKQPGRGSQQPPPPQQQQQMFSRRSTHGGMHVLGSNAQKGRLLGNSSSVSALSTRGAVARPYGGHTGVAEHVFLPELGILPAAFFRPPVPFPHRSCARCPSLSFFSNLNYRRHVRTHSQAGQEDMSPARSRLLEFMVRAPPSARLFALEAITERLQLPVSVMIGNVAAFIDNNAKAMPFSLSLNHMPPALAVGQDLLKLVKMASDRDEAYLAQLAAKGQQQQQQQRDAQGRSGRSASGKGAPVPAAASAAPTACEVDAASLGHDWQADGERVAEILDLASERTLFSSSAIRGVGTLLALLGAPGAKGGGGGEGTGSSNSSSSSGAGGAGSHAAGGGSGGSSTSSGGSSSGGGSGSSLHSLAASVDGTDAVAGVALILEWDLVSAYMAEQEAAALASQSELVSEESAASSRKAKSQEKKRQRKKKKAGGGAAGAGESSSSSGSKGAEAEAEAMQEEGREDSGVEVGPASGPAKALAETQGEGGRGEERMTGSDGHGRVPEGAVEEEAETTLPVAAGTATARASRGAGAGREHAEAEEQGQEQQGPLQRAEQEEVKGEADGMLWEVSRSSRRRGGGRGGGTGAASAAGGGEGGGRGASAGAPGKGWASGKDSTGGGGAAHAAAAAGSRDPQPSKQGAKRAAPGPGQQSQQQQQPPPAQAGGRLVAAQAGGGSRGTGQAQPGRPAWGRKDSGAVAAAKAGVGVGGSNGAVTQAGETGAAGGEEAPEAVAAAAAAVGGAGGGEAGAAAAAAEDGRDPPCQAEKGREGAGEGAGGSEVLAEEAGGGAAHVLPSVLLTAPAVDVGSDGRSSSGSLDSPKSAKVHPMAGHPLVPAIQALASKAGAQAQALGRAVLPEPRLQTQVQSSRGAQDSAVQTGTQQQHQQQQAPPGSSRTEGSVVCSGSSGWSSSTAPAPAAAPAPAGPTSVAAAQPAAGSSSGAPSARSPAPPAPLSRVPKPMKFGSIVVPLSVALAGGSSVTSAAMSFPSQPPKEVQQLASPPLHGATAAATPLSPPEQSITPPAGAPRTPPLTQERGSSSRALASVATDTAVPPPLPSSEPPRGGAVQPARDPQEQEPASVPEAAATALSDPPRPLSPPSSACTPTLAPHVEQPSPQSVLPRKGEAAGAAEGEGKPGPAVEAEGAGGREGGTAAKGVGTGADAEGHRGSQEEREAQEGAEALAAAAVPSPEGPGGVEEGSEWQEVLQHALARSAAGLGGVRLLLAQRWRSALAAPSTAFLSPQQSCPCPSVSAAPLPSEAATGAAGSKAAVGTAAGAKAASSGSKFRAEEAEARAEGGGLAGASGSTSVPPTAAARAAAATATAAAAAAGVPAGDAVAKGGGKSNSQGKAPLEGALIGAEQGEARLAAAAKCNGEGEEMAGGKGGENPTVLSGVGGVEGRGAEAWQEQQRKRKGGKGGGRGKGRVAEGRAQSALDV